MAPQMSKTAAAAAAVAGIAFVALPSQGVDVLPDLMVPLSTIICPPVFVQKCRIFELSVYIRRSLDVVEVAIALIGAVLI